MWSSLGDLTVGEVAIHTVDTLTPPWERCPCLQLTLLWERRALYSEFCRVEPCTQGHSVISFWIKELVGASRRVMKVLPGKYKMSWKYKRQRVVHSSNKYLCAYCAPDTVLSINTLLFLLARKLWENDMKELACVLNLEVYIHGFKQASVGLRGFQEKLQVQLDWSWQQWEGVQWPSLQR